MFKKLKERILSLEVVLDSVLELLQKKDVLNRNEIQIEILARAGERLRMKKKFFLHEIPTGSKIYGFQVSGNENVVIILDKIDGVFSHCHIEGEPEKVCHLSASLELVKYKDGYKEA